MESFQVYDKNNFRKIYNSQNSDLLGFIDQHTKDFLDRFFSEEWSYGNNYSTEHLQALWKSLIISAIHFLRINDFRERNFLISSEPESSGLVDKNKTTINNEGADRAAALSAYGIEELYKYFEQFTKFESTLYGVDQYYRDHVLHPLNVWLIGLNILDDYVDVFKFRSYRDIKVEKSPQAQPSWFQESNNENISSTEIAAMWTIIALTHDLGYPLEKVDRVNYQLEQMLSQFGNIGFVRSSFNFQSQHDYLVKHLINIISSNVLKSESKDICYTHVSPKYFAKFSKSWEMFDHGFVSGLILLRSLTFFLETDVTSDPHSQLSYEDARQFAIRSEILHAIAAHTAPKVYHLSANTLSFLLVLCDELQEWGRPNMSDLRSGNLRNSNTHKITIEKCSIRIDRSDIHCCIEYEKKESYETQKRMAIRAFKNWHERLRPAVDDKSRVMHFIWKIKFGATETGNSTWSFELDTSRQSFLQVKTKGPTPNSFISLSDFSIYE